MREILIGRDLNCDIVVEPEYTWVSGRHAVMYIDLNGEIVFQDISTNGSSVNGKPVKSTTIKVAYGAPILLGGNYPLSWQKIQSLLYGTAQPNQQQAANNNRYQGTDMGGAQPYQGGGNNQPRQMGGMQGQMGQNQQMGPQGQMGQNAQRNGQMNQYGGQSTQMGGMSGQSTQMGGMSGQSTQMGGMSGQSTQMGGQQAPRNAQMGGMQGQMNGMQGQMGQNAQRNGQMGQYSTQASSQSYGTQGPAFQGNSAMQGGATAMQGGSSPMQGGAAAMNQGASSQSYASAPSNTTNYGISANPMVDNSTINQPDESFLTSWNWGAFFLLPIWGFGNGCWWAFLISPFFLISNIIMAVFGTRLAWKNKKWDNFYQFRTVQNTWSKVGIIYFIYSIAMAILVFLLLGTVVGAMFGSMNRYGYY